MLMPYQRPLSGRLATVCRSLAGVSLVLAAVLRLLYLSGETSLDLAPDEAHYWDWSRHLDWSYYSKGPLVAWLIRGSCELFGGLSLAVSGSEMLAVRLPAVVCGSLLLLSLYLLTLHIFEDELLGLGVVVIGLSLPVLAAGSSLMTIDAPYCCCWGWALYLSYRAIFRGSNWAWPLAGLVIALGVLAKYNMVLFVPSVGLFLLTSREHRRLLLRPGFWSLAGLGALGGGPILVWNVRNDWVTFQHVHNLAGLKESTPFHWLGPIEYLAGQFALMLGFWFVAWILALWASRPWQEADARKRFLWWTSLPMFLVFLVFSFRTGGGELNWPVAAYLSGMILAAGWLRDRLRHPGQAGRGLLRIGLAFTVLLGAGLTLLVHRTDLVRPVFVAISGPATERHPLPLRRFDPSCRLRGWRTLGRSIDEIREELRARGIEPVLAATSWALPGEIGFYCQGHPEVFNVGRVQGDRHSQYDLWRPNPLADPDTFRGRTFLIVNAAEPVLAAFGRVEKARVVRHEEGGHPIAVWTVSICHDFQGFPQSMRDEHY